MYGDWGEGCVGVIIGSNTMGGGGIKGSNTMRGEGGIEGSNTMGGVGYYTVGNNAMYVQFKGVRDL